MKKILHIISSSRTKDSANRTLGNAIEEKITGSLSGTFDHNFGFIENFLSAFREEQVDSWFIPAENRTTEQNGSSKTFGRCDCAIAGLILL
jgi:FMN-dependent NADH-azoreductase